MELRIFPLLGRAASGGVFKCACWLIMTLGSLSGFSVFLCTKTVFILYAFYLFTQCILLVILLIVGVTDVTVTGDCSGYCVKTSVCFVVVTAL